MIKCRELKERRITCTQTWNIITRPVQRNQIHCQAVWYEQLTKTFANKKRTKFYDIISWKLEGWKAHRFPNTNVVQSNKIHCREVKTSALVSRRSWVRIPPKSPVKFFPQTLGKAPSIQCYTHVDVRQNEINGLFLHFCQVNELIMHKPWTIGTFCYQ